MNTDFRDLFSELNAAEARYLVVGAYAVVYYTEPRYTKDVDIWVEPTPENSRRVFAALAAFGAPLDNLRPEDLTQRDLIYQIGIEPNRIDILMDVGGVDFAEAYSRATVTTCGHVPIRLLALDDLIAAKRHAGRPQDLLDLTHLEQARNRR
jgi:hypothetical protein